MDFAVNIQINRIFILTFFCFTVFVLRMAKSMPRRKQYFINNFSGDAITFATNGN